jgi:hypothetical protein
VGVLNWIFCNSSNNDICWLAKTLNAQAAQGNVVLGRSVCKLAGLAVPRAGVCYCWVTLTTSSLLLCVMHGRGSFSSPCLLWFAICWPCQCCLCKLSEQLADQ